jgi:hypothetical protein
MALEKLKVKIEESPNQLTKEVEVLFNPNQVVISKTGWNEDSKDKKFVFVDEPASLSIELFFDTTLGKSPPENVQKYTQPIYSLTQIKGNLQRPPLCKLIWGRTELLPLGLLKSVTKTLTHFLENGTPVAAKLSCNFQEWQDPTQRKKIQNPIDDPIRIVKQGETLTSIAAEEYNDPSLWRVIAQENRLDNPRLLTPGQRLTVPPLRANSITQRR